MRTMNRVIADSSTGSDLIAKILGGFALLALLLAGIGLFGVLSYVVALRTQEMGIRLGLGAKPNEILGLVPRKGMALVAVGVGIGTFASLALPKLTETRFNAPEVRMISGDWVIDGIARGWCRCLLSSAAGLRRSIPWWHCDMSEAS